MIASKDYAAVGQLVKNLISETENLIKICQQIAIYSNGGIPYPNSALSLTPVERDVALGLLQSKMDAEESRFLASIGVTAQKIIR